MPKLIKKIFELLKNHFISVLSYENNSMNQNNQENNLN